MSNRGLIPVFEGRPPLVIQNGITFHVSIHDAQHIRERRKWRQKLHNHPDHGGTNRVASNIIKGYKRWKQRERAWYAALGLDMPDSCGLRSIVHEEKKPAKHGKLASARIAAGLCRLCGLPRGTNGASTVCRSCANALAERRRVKVVEKGLCSSCSQPRGENGTSRQCRRCADKSADLERKRRAGKVVGAFRRHGGIPKHIPVAHTTVYHTAEEKRVWAELADQEQKTMSKLIRDAIRAKYPYILGHEF